VVATYTKLGKARTTKKLVSHFKKLTRPREKGEKRGKKHKVGVDQPSPGTWNTRIQSSTSLMCGGGDGGNLKEKGKEKKERKTRRKG